MLCVIWIEDIQGKILELALSRHVISFLLPFHFSCFANFFLVWRNQLWVIDLQQEKRLRVNMRLKKLQERVKEQQEKVGEKACLLSTSLCLIDHYKSIVFLFTLLPSIKQAVHHRLQGFRFFSLFTSHFVTFTIELLIT